MVVRLFIPLRVLVLLQLYLLGIIPILLSILWLLVVVAVEVQMMVVVEVLEVLFQEQPL